MSLYKVYPHAFPELQHLQPPKKALEIIHESKLLHSEILLNRHLYSKRRKGERKKENL